MIAKYMLGVLAMDSVLAQQTCGDLRDAFQSNECCAATMGRQLSAPLHAEAATTIASQATQFSQMLFQSANFTKFGGSTLGSAVYGPDLLATYKPIGTHTAHICEATDAAWSSTAVVADGMSGDTEYPYGDIKVLATMGEYYPPTGYMLVGVPDGMGAMLLDSTTVRIVFQSESYGPLNWWCTNQGCGDSFPFLVNSNGASFTGSHVMYVDYDRSMLADFMLEGAPEAAAGMIKGAGEAIRNAYNLMGNMIEPRSASGCTANPHYSNTDPHGCNPGWNTIMLGPEPERADWVMQSLCSAHLEEKHQWGGTMGVEDDLFITNEEWTSFVTGSNYTGIPAHVIDMATLDAYATGVFTLGGFEKIVEFNCGHPGFVCFAPSGYNGNFDVSRSAEAARRTAEVGPRPDGTAWVFPKYVVPARVYIGVKGKDATGAAATDFLSRNGLAYGKVYGFATDVTQTTGGRYQEDWHKNAAQPGDTVSGGFYPIAWQWSGVVTNFMHDGSWDFQLPTSDGLHFWNQGGSAPGSTYDTYGSCKTEHNSPDPYGGARVLQSSTCGYFGIYDLTGVLPLLTAAMADGSYFPTRIPAVYTALQGETDITAQIQLGGKGMSANGNDARRFVDSSSAAAAGPGGGKVTFEDIDGIEWIAAAGTTDGYIVIQEDGGNYFGERTFITKVSMTGPLTYYFIAQSGGRMNTRMLANVGVPARTNDGLWASSAHEFSGVIDLSGMLQRDASGNFVASAGVGATKRMAERMIPINNKTIAFGLQAHQLTAGIVRAMSGDRGGQLYAYKPNLPASAA
jgi:hypothetical protein